MTNSKKTKRALLSSVISLILCLSMLIGTTFAWFTDSVSSGKNQIVAGNLDIELEYLVGENWDEDWATVGSDTNVFKENTLWEPGHTEVVYLKIANVGSLDLKYQLGINVWEEITSTSVEGNEIKLSNYLEFGIIEDVTAAFAGREDARKAVVDADNAEKLSTGYSPDGKLYDAKQAAAEADKASEKYLAMVVYMPETVGNEANHLIGEPAPMINLGINLMATQLMSENDSFGNDYDEEAIYDAMPGASFTIIKPPAVKLRDIGNLNAPAGESVELETAYSFATTQTPEQAEENAYALWNADFVVTFDAPVKAGSVVMGGYYKSWCDAHTGGEWLAFEIPDDIPANTPFRLLDFAGIRMNYRELCQYVQEFKCGLANLSSENCGVTMTADIVLYETYKDDTNSTQENGTAVKFGSYSYTFEYPENMPQAEVEDADQYENSDITWGNYGSWSPSNPSQQLESAYVFTANDTAETVAESPYKDWICDYYVSLDQDLEVGQLFLGGNYGTFGWVGFENPVAVAANEEVALLGSVTTIPWTYEMVVNNVGSFTCGVADINDALTGATFTVHLRLTNPEDPTDFFNVNSVRYTFA